MKWELHWQNEITSHYAGRSVVFRFKYAHKGVVKSLRRRREPLGPSGGMLPEKMFIFRASEMPFPMSSWGKVHKSEHNKTLTIQIRK